jgi:glucose dehydrogenase
MHRCLRLVLVAVLILPLVVVPTAAIAQPAPNLRDASGAEWLTNGGNWGNQRYSALDKINTSNVKDLKGAWVTHLGSGLGSKYSLEATPIVKDGILFVPTGNDDLFALDAKTGGLLWQYNSGIDQNIQTVCCGWDNRGVAAGDGRLYMGQLDGTFVALDEKSGEVLWKTQLESWQDGYTITSAPLYYDGLVFTGISGAEFGIRGKMTALDARTGQEVWHFWTIPGPGELGFETRPQRVRHREDRPQRRHRLTCL